MLYSDIAFAQDSTLYVVDSIPITEPKEETMLNEDISSLEVITDLSKIKKHGYEGKINKLIFITTKAYLNRSPAEKLILSTNKMVKKDGLWYLKDSDKPFTGSFIDYFLNGKKQGEGYLQDGRIDGVRTVYYPNGNKRYFYTYKDGIENGLSEEYFVNGKLRQTGSFANKKEVGQWQVFYSTGKLKRSSLVNNNKIESAKEEVKFFNLLNKGAEQMKEGEFTGAIKKLDEAEKLNTEYADLYFYRGTAKLNNFDFDSALADFDKAIVLEPLYMEAISNRAFVRIRKYEFKDGRLLSKNKEVTIMTANDNLQIPKEELEKICADLKLGYELGDNKPMIIDAMKKYCN